MMRKPIAYCFGIENSLEDQKLLFLDIDSPSLPEALVERLNSDPDIPAYLILKTNGGHHVICFKPLGIDCWLDKLEEYAEFVDPQFYAFSVKNNYSVLRISPKYSLYDHKTVISPAPTFHQFVELQKYPETAISLLYRSIYRYETYFVYFEEKMTYKAKIHLYLTASR
ncbi:MAG: hypothetical protein ABIK73_08625 [candidate division WOR-3 bacterium]